MQPADHYYYQTELRHSRSTDFRDRERRRQPSPCAYTKNELAEYVEWGHKARLTAFLSGRLGRVDCGTRGDSGIGDVELGVRGPLQPGVDSRSWQLTLVLPAGYPRDTPTRLAYGRPGLDLGIARGDDLGQGAKLEYGVSARFWQGPPANEWRGVARCFRERGVWTTSAGVRGIWGWGAADPEALSLLSYQQLPKYDLITAEFGIRRRLTRGWGVAIGIDKDLWGRNSGQSDGIVLSLFRTGIR